MRPPERDEHGRFIRSSLDMNQRMRLAAGYPPVVDADGHHRDARDADGQPQASDPQPAPAGSFDGGQATITGAGSAPAPDSMNDRLRRAALAQIYGLDK